MVVCVRVCECVCNTPQNCKADLHTANFTWHI